jgi:hypothetical protein
MMFLLFGYVVVDLVRGSRPAVTPLYHALRDLSIGFSKFLEKIFSGI